MAAARRYTAIITARGGSKGLPGKNIAMLGGRPMIEYTIEAARCSWVDRIVVTTDDERIAAVSRNAGASMIDRPAALATGTASSVDTVEHALGVLASEGAPATHFVLLQPTSPLRTAAQLDQCLALFSASDAECAVSVCEMAHHPAKTLVEHHGSWVPFSGNWNSFHAPRQALGRAVRPNGAIYAMASADFLRYRKFVFEPLFPFFMSEESSVDVDTTADLQMAERLLAQQPSAA